MKRISLATVAILVAGSGYLYLKKPLISQPGTEKIEVTQAPIERGKYLYNLADCDGCHSLRDFSRFGGPVVAGGRGQGMLLPAELGLPGVISASNISSDPETGIGAWTDGEKIRAIREGVSRDGQRFFR